MITIINIERRKRNKEAEKPKTIPAGRFHNYLIYRYLKILLLISCRGSAAGIRKRAVNFPYVSFRYPFDILIPFEAKIIDF